ncbi:MAG: AAA family ATPase [Eubacterium sp.]|nr:AAA family ATPase [Eubacterium sp.]
MEENKVKLIGLTVNGLYGCYNYNVNFNTDVTFIYGLNGCGKTTILNITEAIITGQLFKLFNYKFNNIELKYAKSSNLNEIKSIVIESKDNIIKILYSEKSYTLKKIETDDNMRTIKNIREINHRYFISYEFLKEIRDTFNYVYLPLNRSYTSKDEFEDLFQYSRIHRRFLPDEDIYIDGNSKDETMFKIEAMVYQNHSKANAIINRYNDSFRDSMLKPQIEINNTYNINDILDQIYSYDVPSLKATQNSYIRILKEFNLLDEKEEEDYNSFFKNFIKDFSSHMKKKKEMTQIGTPIELVFKFQEISRIKKTIDIANKIEQQKASVTKPMETFINTMNSFIQNNEDGKEICISNDGQVYFKTKHSQKRISIHNLSSGEKQLITFFANLIFMVKNKSSGIFVVDEPELSLHLSWQRIFIDKVLEINNDIQLIFATHAPEIIGKRRNKMFKLEKLYAKVDDIK